MRSVLFSKKPAVSTTVLLILFLTVTNYCHGQARRSEDTLYSQLQPVITHFNLVSESELDSSYLQYAQKLPYTYLGQMLNGMAGVNTLRSSGEPGSAPFMLLRGISIPVGSEKDIYANRPLIVVDGIPLIRNDHPYQLSIKTYPLTGIGSGIDISSLIDINNIRKVKVIKGAEAVALYGIHAANGAVVITTPSPRKGEYKIGLNLYSGVALPPSLNIKGGPYLVNGAFEGDLLIPFYHQYASASQMLNFPSYLADSTSAAYFGPSDWNDLYYRVALQHGAGINITGGSDRAKFRFGVGEHTENGVADKTALKRYNVYYDMHIIPLTNLGIRIFVQAATANRNRNHSLRERFAEMEYFPNQEYPLPPNKEFLQQYYSYLDEGIDKNLVNSIQAVADMKYTPLQGLALNSRFSVDYNDNHRNFFVPGALNDGNSYNSYFSSMNRRILWNNYLQYNRSFSNHSYLNVQLGQSLEYDRMQYSYIRGYRGPSDFIKIIEVNSEDTTWLTHKKNFIYSYKDYLNQNIVSFYGSATYNLRDKYTATLYLRSDGSSYFGNGYYWGISSVATLGWDLKQEPWFRESDFFKALNLGASAGRTVREPAEDKYGYGPYYTVDIGWEGSEKVSTYASFPALGLPFNDGYVGGGIKWSYTDQWEIGIDMETALSLNLSIHAYSKVNRDLLISVPVGGAAYGFSGQWLNGMDVKNSGVEINLRKKFRLMPYLSWESGIAMQYNQNKLLKLPGGLQAITYGQRRLSVGKAVDQFWLLQNEGIYQKESDVPVINGKKLSLNGVPFHAGDPRWKDVNQDGIINDADRVLEGHVVAPVHGSWNNVFKFRNWTLGFSFLYSFGKNILNGAIADRFDFAHREGVSGLEGIKELTFWQIKGNLNKYPKYNPWSLVDPYQTDQTLFYEKGGFVKLQSISLQYDLTTLPMIKKSGISKLQLYLTGTNLFIYTPYSGYDPSLTNYFGYNYGYGQPLPLTVTFGIHADF